MLHPDIRRMAMAQGYLTLHAAAHDAAADRAECDDAELPDTEPAADPIA